MYMILQISVQDGTREADSVWEHFNVSKNGCVWVKDSRNINTSNSTCYLETFNAFIK